MGFNVSLITVSPNTTIKSSDFNSNMNALNNANSFTAGSSKIDSTGIYIVGQSFMMSTSGVRLKTGTWTDVGFVGGTGNATINHTVTGLDGNGPSMCFVQYSPGGSSGNPTTIPKVTTFNSTTVTVTADAGRPWWCLCVKNN